MRLIDADKIPFDMVMQNPFDEQSEKVEVIKKRKIEQMPTIQAIPLDMVKQAREEIEQNAYPIVHGVNNHDMGMTLGGIFQVLDKLIADSET